MPATKSDSTYSIEPAQPRHLPWLPSVELAAARLLVGHAPEAVLATATSAADLERACRDGRLWVALADDRPVGFAHVKLLEPRVAHLEELDVHPDHGRRGVGRRLVEAVCEWARWEGFESVTLSTFRDVPWNRPFYERLGFVVVPAESLTPALARLVETERERGLDTARRVVMRRVLSASKIAG
jgi:GNAT superfamily N-acetyltransferase